MTHSDSQHHKTSHQIIFKRTRETLKEYNKKENLAQTGRRFNHDVKNPSLSTWRMDTIHHTGSMRGEEEPNALIHQSQVTLPTDHMCNPLSIYL